MPNHGRYRRKSHQSQEAHPQCHRNRKYTSRQSTYRYAIFLTDPKIFLGGCASILISEQAASIPEGQNELKRNQLRELAALNGTLRDDENQACQNCGEIGHRKYDCPQQKNYTASIICRICGNAGHMARDCPERQRGQDWRQNPTPPAGRPRIDGGDAQEREYASLMQEISGGGPIGDNTGAARIEGGPGSYDNDGANGYGAQQDTSHLKPWQRGPTGAAAPWHRSREQNQSSGGGPPPWARGGGAGSGGDNYGGGQAPAPWAQQGSAAPWQQPPPSAGGQPNYGGGYAGYGVPGYGDQSGGYQAPGMGAPPGLGAPPGMGMPGGYGQAGSPPPPPPPPGGAPPPPPGDAPPPPVCI